ncbi:MAG: hypothetical protein IJ719_23310 [Clostridia bacterium]|nr:hypothetical protein [Clostridia bacterium]
MFYSCGKCGAFRPDQIIDTEKNLVICPECGDARPFKRMPLYAIGGASGIGKSALCKAIAGKVNGVVVLDGDVFSDGKRYSTQNTEDFYENVLRIAMNISQSGVAVAIFHAGFGVPANLEHCIARRYFSEIHYLGIYCSDQELVKRLSTKSSAQGASGKGYITAMKGFNAFFRSYYSPDSQTPEMDKIDTTDSTPEKTAEKVIEWIQSKQS